jgi:hypothetical protein
MPRHRAFLSARLVAQRLEGADGPAVLRRYGEPGDEFLRLGEGPTGDAGISPATATRAPERLRPEAFSPSLACRL